MKLREFLRLGVIIGALPSTIANGQALDANPVMSDFNWIVSQVNANGATASSVTAIQNQIATWGPLSNFTPTLAFGGASVGITYNAGATKGVYTTIAGMWFIWFTLILTNKGSSVGFATINNMPVVANANLNANQPVGNCNLNQVTFADKFVTLIAAPGQTQLQLATTPSGTPGPNFLDNTAFVNTSSIFGMAVFPQ